MSFDGLQRRAAAGARTAAGLASALPAYFVAFDVLKLDGRELLRVPYRDRRTVLEKLFTDHALTAPWTLCPATRDLATAREWLTTWTEVSGVEGLLWRDFGVGHLTAVGRRECSPVVSVRRDTTRVIYGRRYNRGTSVTSEGLVFDHEAVLIHGFELYEGTNLDVRSVVSGMAQDVKDAYLFEEVAWSRFGHAYGSGHDVPQRLTALRSQDAETAGLALDRLRSSVVHQGTVGSVAPLTVPFLLRIAAVPSTHSRAGVLGLAASAARDEYWGHAARDTFLTVATKELRSDCSGYPMHWSIEASRNAITADVGLLLPLLDDTDPDVRTYTCYTLATASGAVQRITDALRTRLTIETIPGVRASLVLATAELGREHAVTGTAAWARSLWTDPTQPADIRVSAALGWLCLVDEPVTNTLRTTLAPLLTDALAGAMDHVPWIRQVARNGLDRTVEQMLNDEPFGLGSEDPWA
ncbi:hypothetical protein ACGFXC_33525 [Streptomyces sp. NPDC048507]|uniref:ATP-dependent DNA ligase n=1 Tax=Streptomyces sp. NPDC048507 TaxID=3365560 RepID=UPI003712A4AB